MPSYTCFHVHTPKLQLDSSVYIFVSGILFDSADSDPIILPFTYEPFFLNFKGELNIIPSLDLGLWAYAQRCKLPLTQIETRMELSRHKLHRKEWSPCHSHFLSHIFFPSQISNSKAPFPQHMLQSNPRGQRAFSCTLDAPHFKVAK